MFTSDQNIHRALLNQQIPDAQTDVAGVPEDTFLIGTIAADARLSDRLCGRQFSTANDNNDRRMSRSVCSKYNCATKFATRHNVNIQFKGPFIFES